MVVVGCMALADQQSRTIQGDRTLAPHAGILTEVQLCNLLKC